MPGVIQHGLTFNGARVIVDAIGGTRTGDLKLAFYTDGVELTRKTAAYIPTGEASGGTYVAGGFVVTPVTGTTGNGWCISFEDLPDATGFRARAALLYLGDKSIAVFDFGHEQDIVGGIRFNPVDKGGVMKVAADETDYSR